MIRIVTLNTRLQTIMDGAHQYKYRKDGILRFFASEIPDVIGFQELTRDMLEGLAQAMDSYAFIGQMSRRSGGECTAIAYRKDTLCCADSGTFWLSPTPMRVGSRFWLQSPDARTCTHAEFICRETGVRFRYFNTHLDHLSPYARSRGVLVILSRIAALQRKERLPLFLGGDLNFTPRNRLYARCVEKGLWDGQLVDLSADIRTTFHWFGALQRPLKLDYFFTDDAALLHQVRVKAYKTDDRGRLLSDHCALGLEWLPMATS